MPSKRVWVVDGITVTRADVRQWMQSVGHRVPTRMERDYIARFDVIGKIARHKAAGIFESTIARASADAGLTVRKARSPGKLARIAHAWPEAANEKGAHEGRPLLYLVR